METEQVQIETQETVSKQEEVEKTLISPYEGTEQQKEKTEQEQKTSQQNSSYEQEHFDDPKRFVRGDDYLKELANLRSMEKYQQKYAELYPRKMVQIKTSEVNKQKLKIMQFNILADGLSGLYVNSKMKDKEFVGVSKEALDFNYRGFRIVEEIMRHDPDVVTLEEVDQFEFFKHYLQGYDGIFAPKKNSPCTKIGKEMGKKMLPDGVAIFFKANKFKIVFSRVFGTDEKEKVDVPAVVLHLKRIQTEQIKMNDFVVVSTHLKSTKDMEGEVQRLKQIQFLASEVLQYQEKIEQENRRYLPIFIGCDLNAPPKDTKGFPPFTYASIVDDKLFKKLLQDFKDKHQNSKNVVLNMKLYQKTYNKLRFASAYKFLLGSEPKYTTWKKRKGGEDKHTIDYLFFQHLKGVVVTSVLNIPDERTVNRESLLPGWEYPSDHFAIMATFEF